MLGVPIFSSIFFFYGGRVTAIFHSRLGALFVPLWIVWRNILGQRGREGYLEEGEGGRDCFRREGVLKVTLKLGVGHSSPSATLMSVWGWRGMAQFPKCGSIF